ncbi:MAG TPA: hypothetical protein VH111_11180 [Steroidobacteraceae bacterium]|nr:hypothetical protein [Steroidobacteraceae bacterium]
MRLLDHIAQCTEPVVVRQDRGDVWRLAGAADFALPLARCPLRYVLSDELTRACTALAYSEGDQLSGCLDLMRIPAEEMWIEWNEKVRRDEVSRLVVPESPVSSAPDALRAGTLVNAPSHGRSGSLRTFWLTAEESPRPLLAAVETVITLDGGVERAAPDALLEGGTVAVRDSRSQQVDALLQCVGFRLEPSWQRYYQGSALSGATRAQVISQSLAVVAFDAPMLLALFLLMAVGAELVETRVNPVHLNAKRARLGRRPLLEHIEVSAPVFAAASLRRADAGHGVRRGPRFHHVRGHLVRRRNTIYWRGPHWRGHVRLGSVRSRTVELRLPG